MSTNNDLAIGSSSISAGSSAGGVEAENEAREVAPNSAVAPRAPWELYTNRQRQVFLSLLFLVSTSSFLDRYVMSVALEPIKLEFHLSDTMLGLVGGVSFSILYATLGIPVARWADRGNRRTIIALTLTVWSVMTVFCGLAQSFWQLVLARVGMGAGESGTTPPAQSLIADYFPSDRRATALAVLAAAGAVGYALGIGLGGFIVASHGWRTALVLSGVPGLVLAAIVRLGLREPRYQLGFPSAHVPFESIAETLLRLRQKPSYLYAVVGYVLYLFLTYGSLMFMPSFSVRALHASLSEMTAVYGTTATIATLIGTLTGGPLADRLSRSDVRWLAWMPALGCLLATPLYVLSYCTHQLWPFIGITFAGDLAITGALPSIGAMVLRVCGSRRRAMAVATLLFCAMLVGAGLGPLLTGVLSDALGAIYGVDGLRYSLMALTILYLGAAAAFYRCGVMMPNDIED